MGGRFWGPSPSRGRRVWPPAVIVVVPLLVVGTLASWMSGLPIDRTILPIGLNLLGLSMTVWGEWRPPSQRAPDQTGWDRVRSLGGRSFLPAATASNSAHSRAGTRAMNRRRRFAISLGTR